ncbi:hypothetical protein [Streptomyces sp. NPDC046197]|uniref:hypothetical protein n=1 Tax=Streptomyces sp. NPDC046197 TaxID=3154337 RepID=UPI0033F2D8EC
MTDRPYEGSPYEGYEGHQGYDPYAQQYSQGSQQRYPHQQEPQHQQHGQQPQQHGQQPQQYGQPQHQPQHQQYVQPQPQQQAWPGQHQAYEDPQAAQQYTQQWQGQTWETQTQAHAHQQPVAAAETAYLPPLGHQQAAAAAAHGVPGTTGPGTGHPGTGHGAAAAFAAPVTEPPASEPRRAQPSSAGSEGEPAYGPATVAGNTRVTGAQRARAEGRSPIIDPGMQPAALTALLGLLLAGAAELGTYALLLPLVVLQGVTAAGWFRLNGMWPARQGIALAFAGALVADVAVLGAGREHAPAAILGTLGVWVLLALVLQLRSHADPDERMYGLMAAVASAALAIVATGHLAAGADAVAVGASAVAVAVLARALPLPTAASVVVAVLAAAGAGIAVGGMTGLGAKGALLGAGAGVCALIGHRVAAYDFPSRFVHFTAGVALPLTAAAPVVWVLGRALG